MQQRGLHDLAKLLGAKEAEYKKLNDKDVNAASFQDYVNKALNRGPLMSV